MDATMSINPKPLDNKLSWSLTLTNKCGITASSYGYITLDLTNSNSNSNTLPPVTATALSPLSTFTDIAEPDVTGSDNIVIAPATTLLPATTSSPLAVEKTTKDVSFNQDDKIKHITHIKKLLDDVEQAKGKENKAAVAYTVLTYLIDSALEFTKFYPRFKETVINKCYEFKLLHPEFICLNQKANTLLTKLGVSTDIPSDFVFIPPVQQPVVEKVAEEKPYNPEMELFISAAKIHDDKNAIQNPEKWYQWYQHCLKIRNVKGVSPAEKIYHFFNVRSETTQRTNLMKELFTKHNLVFGESVMPFYNEWVKSFVYNGKGKVNRYIKMNEFINIHKGLFTAITH